jgi:hypothetical protein
VSSIEGLVRGSWSDGKWHRARLIKELTAREDFMADQLRAAGAQFGLYPEIVAEVLATVGIGTQPSPEERQIIRQNFVALMERLQRDNGV